jgi:hypothetical protein
MTALDNMEVEAVQLEAVELETKEARRLEREATRLERARQREAARAAKRLEREAKAAAKAARLEAQRQAALVELAPYREAWAVHDEVADAERDDLQAEIALPAAAPSRPIEDFLGPRFFIESLKREARGCAQHASSEQSDELEPLA